MKNICACRMGRSKHEIFSILKERIWKTIIGWGGNFLSTVAREVSIKVVLQTIPSYLMGCFLLLRNVTNILHTAIRSSQWSLGSGKKMPWLSWAKFCEPKLKGGIIRYFNLALLAKQEWRLISHLDSLLSRIYKAIYFPQGSFLTVKIGWRPSAIRRNILPSRPYLEQGLRYRVGDMTRIAIQTDPLLLDDGNYRTSTPRTSISSAPGWWRSLWIR